MSNKKRKLAPGSNGKNTGSEAEGKQLQQGHWTSVLLLPEDVLKFIFAKLNWVDRVRLCGVCKNFASLSREIPSRPMQRLPWLMTMFYEGPTPADQTCRCASTFSLTDPSSNRTYNVKINEVYAREYMVGTALKPSYSRHGCLSFGRLSGNYLCFSLYMPYNKEFVVLPKLEFDPAGSCLRVTFSMDPTSLDYGFFFYVGVNRSMLTLDISMCHVGDNSWSDLKFDLSADHRDAPRLQDAICADGYLYCVLDSGNRLVILDVSRREWKLFTNCMQLPPELPPGCPFMDLAFYNGVLFLVHKEWFENERVLTTYFWRFDKFLKQWVRQQNLGNLALFLGHPLFLVEAVGELSPYANTIHTIDSFGLTFTSFSGEFRAAVLYQSQGDNSHKCSRQYWIEPPLLMPPK